jgi:hypothetical protein
MGNAAHAQVLKDHDICSEEAQNQKLPSPGEVTAVRRNRAKYRSFHQLFERRRACSPPSTPRKAAGLTTIRCCTQLSHVLRFLRQIGDLAKNRLKSGLSMETAMRAVSGALFLLLLSAMACNATGTFKLAKYQIADNSSDACLANCSSQNVSCERVCPETFSTPCLSACDSQAQTCQQSCRRK